MERVIYIYFSILDQLVDVDHPFNSVTLPASHVARSVRGDNRDTRACLYSGAKKKKAIFQTEKKEEVTTGFVVSLGGSLAYLFLVLCWLECMVDSRVANESISILPVRLARFFDHDLTPRVL